jgi:hypothetical protein
MESVKNADGPAGMQTFAAVSSVTTVMTSTLQNL